MPMKRFLYDNYTKSLTITQLLSAESEQYVVPVHQRQYSWHEKQLWELLDDVSFL